MLPITSIRYSCGPTLKSVRNYVPRPVSARAIAVAVVLARSGSIQLLCVCDGTPVMGRRMCWPSGE
jgi:hypothetical protein